MNRKIYILPIISIFIFCILSSNLSGQNQSILDFTVKELNGDTIKLRDRLDPSSNYIIAAMAFWCDPCIPSIDKFNYHKTYWKDRFNVDILIVEDEHWNDLPFIEGKIEELGWDLDIVVSDDQFSTVGISSILSYFFKGTASDAVEHVFGDIEKFLLEKVDSIKFSPILDSNFKQVKLVDDCDQVVVDKHDVENQLEVDGHVYKKYNGTYCRENELNGDIYRFDLHKFEEEIHIKFSAALCSRIWLKDFEGDSLSIKILDRYQEDSILHVVTDQMLTNECFDEEVPFEFIQNIGTNAGLDFDIDEGRIVSRLICQERDNDFEYMDDELGNMCLSLSSKPILTEDLNIQVFPNPTDENLHINLNFEGEKKIELYTVDGQIVSSIITSDSKTEIALPEDSRNTLYLVKISTQYGIVTKKVLSIGN